MTCRAWLSVLALSSRFDGRSLVDDLRLSMRLSVLALSSRFDGPPVSVIWVGAVGSFSTRSVESF